MTRTLWGGTGSLDGTLAAYTAGDDRTWDRRLLRWDVLATLAHADGLAAAHLLTREDHRRVRRALVRALADVESGRLTVTDEDEDVHTALEGYLVKLAGRAGERVHTGRSRNDQVLADLRLYTKDALFQVERSALDAAAALEAFARRHRRVLWPGYTHQRRAMPSSVGLWAAAHAEAILDDLHLAGAALALVDRSPLGSAAGFGVPVRLPRRRVARSLGFGSVQWNVAAVQPSRGKTDVAVIAALWTLAHDLGTLAWDVILLSSEEYGLLSLPAALATGSSIMPHKRNPDLFELTRAREGMVAGWLAQAIAVAGKLPSGYHRDAQMLKPPLMQSLDAVRDMASAVASAVPSLRVDHARCAAAVGGDLLATDEVYRRVRDGVPFRSAYRAVAAGVRGGAAAPPLTDAQILGARKDRGGAGDPGLDDLRGRIRAGRRGLARRTEAFRRALDRLVAGA